MFKSAHELLMTYFNYDFENLASYRIEEKSQKGSHKIDIPPEVQRYLDAHIVIESLNLADYELELLQMYALKKHSYVQIASELTRKLGRYLPPARVVQIKSHLLQRIEKEMKFRRLMEE